MSPVCLKNYLPCVCCLFFLLLSSQPAPAQSSPSEDVTGCCQIYIEGSPGPVCLYWNRFLSIISKELIMKMWQEANVTESLEDSRHRASGVYLTHAEPTEIGENQNLHSCDFKDSEAVLTHAEIYGRAKVAGYLGKAGLGGYIVASELTHYTTDVTRSDFPEPQFFLTTRMHCAYFGLSFMQGNYQISGLVLPEYSFVTLHRTTIDNVHYSLTVFYGIQQAFPSLRSSLSHNNILVARNEQFSLSVLATLDSYSHVGTYLTLDFKDIFTFLTKTPLKKIIKKLQNDMVGIETSNGCAIPRLDGEFFRFFLEFIFSHFLLLRNLGGQAGQARVVEVGCVADLLTDLKLLRSLMGSCFENMYVKGFESPTLNNLAARYAANMPDGALLSLRSEERQILFSLLQLGSAFLPASDMIVANLTRFLLRDYEQFSKTLNLTEQQRMDMKELYLSLWNKNYAEGDSAIERNVLSILSLCTSMCTTLEINRMVSIMSHKQGIVDINLSFSPCFLSMRYDLTREKLKTEVASLTDLSAADLEHGSLGFLRTIVARQTTSLSRLPVAHCLRNVSGVLLVVPGENVTFVLVNGKVPNALNFEISEVFLQSNMGMAVAVIPRDCKPSPTITEPIRTINTLTSPRRGCPLCRATIMSYDERDGLQNVITITSKTVQDNLLGKRSTFFRQQDMHMHYLLLLSNGTVVEIRSVYMDRAADILLFTLFFISFCVGIYVLYRLVAYFY